VVHWSRGGARVHNYATGRAVTISGSSLALLDAYSTWRSVRDAASVHRGGPLDRVRRATDRLHRDGLLTRSDDLPCEADARMARFGDWNPAAGFFHAETRNVVFAPFEESRAAQREKASEVARPPADFSPEGAAFLPLPRASTRTPAARAFLARRSWRRFGSRPVALQDLASLLWLTGGVQTWMTTDAGTFALKTSPSGGALHPIEIYVLARQVSDLDPGWYHYSGSSHGLSILLRHDAGVSVRPFLPTQPWFEGAAFILFFVAHYERALWRYAYPRAYRAPFVEAGHLAQTFSVLAADLGLAPFVSMALGDSAIEAAIGADGVTRAVLYAAGAGTRPARTAWAAAPAGVPDPPRRPNTIRRTAAARRR
jgi:SagB-type dehydrogenase family enzyme